jgi:tRNA A37 N6-isopentenylltransferase MiaA|tara:strand:+ start:159 stop:425 length:267 start_codon:yes stop_codon:yes gene_type:complete
MLVSGMPNLKKQEYYRKNREKRLKYQQEWYARNKDKIERAGEILQVTDPEEWEKRKKKKRDYNKRYYEKNRAKILARQKDRYHGREPK